MQDILKRSGLRFQSAADETKFVDHYTKGNVGWTQAAMLLGALTYVSYTIWDWVLYPEIVPTTFALRGGVAAFILFPLTALLSTPLRQWAEVIYLVYCVVPGCVLAGIYLVIPSGFTHAAAGMIIVILFVSTLLPLRLKSLMIFCVMTWTALVISESFGPQLEPGLRFINHFEIGTAYALSLWAVGAREYQARKQFMTAEALRRETERSEASVIELRAAQTHLVQAEKLASLGKIVAGVAHEVSTPLGSALTTSTTLEAELKSMSSLLKTGQVRRSDLTKSIERLERGLQMTSASMLRAHELVHSFKQVAIDQSNEDRQTFDLQRWLHETVERLQPLLSRHGLQFEVTCPSGIQIDSYPGPLALVISNLAFNTAVHAYPAGLGGAFTIAVEQPDSLSVRICVADSGVGIPAEARERVFDPFFTTRRDQGSVGLGLHIVFNVVVSTLGGKIDLQSKPAAGARFVIDLPLKASDTPTSAAEEFDRSWKISETKTSTQKIQTASRDW